jgi:hypothetical protein
MRLTFLLLVVAHAFRHPYCLKKLLRKVLPGYRVPRGKRLWVLGNWTVENIGGMRWLVSPNRRKCWGFRTDRCAAFDVLEN